MCQLWLGPTLASAWLSRAQAFGFCEESCQEWLRPGSGWLWPKSELVMSERDEEETFMLEVWLREPTKCWMTVLIISHITVYIMVYSMHCPLDP